MESKSKEYLQENGRANPAIKAGQIGLRTFVMGDIIVNWLKTSESDCVASEAEFAAEACMISTLTAASMAGARARGRTVMSLGSLWEPVSDEHSISI